MWLLRAGTRGDRLWLIGASLLKRPSSDLLAQSKALCYLTTHSGGSDMRVATLCRNSQPLWCRMLSTGRATSLGPDPYEGSRLATSEQRATLFKVSVHVSMCATSQYGSTFLVEALRISAPAQVQRIAEEITPRSPVMRASVRRPPSRVIRWQSLKAQARDH